jgi:hypothetical protein
MAEKRPSKMAMDGYVARADGYLGKARASNESLVAGVSQAPKLSQAPKRGIEAAGYQAKKGVASPVPKGGTSGQKK